MIIYPLPAIELDDKTLSKQIKTIAQVLSNVYYKVVYLKNKGDKPLMRPKRVANIMTKWALTCLANYLKLVEMGLECLKESGYRNDSGEFSDPKHADWWEKYNNIIEFSRDNVPELPYGDLDEDCRQCNNDDIGTYGSACDSHAWGTTTPFPLVIKNNKYIEYAMDCSTNEQVFLTTESYRNYYRAKINKIESAGCPCQDCLCINDSKCHLPIWTRREPPSYLKEIL